MKYDTILFDADDTILDFKKSEREALRLTLESFSIEPKESVITAYSDINDSYWKLLEVGGVTKEKLKIARFADLCSLMGFETDPVKMAQTYEKNLSGMSYLLDDAEAVCRELKKNHRMYIVTNGIKDVQLGRINGTSVKDCFEKAFVSEEVGYEKPRVEYFEAVARAIPNFDKEKTIIIGDSLSSDIKGGISFGIDTCWYNPFGKTKPEEMEITYIVSSLYDILEVLK